MNQETSEEKLFIKTHRYLDWNSIYQDLRMKLIEAESVEIYEIIISKSDFGPSWHVCVGFYNSRHICRKWPSALFSQQEVTASFSP